jgi:PAS domain S-box-containing protein
MKPRHAITRQVLLRLAVSLGLVIALLAFTTRQIYVWAQDSAARERQERLAVFYQTRLQQWDREAALDTRNVRVGIEHSQVLQRATGAARELKTLLTLPEYSRRFSRLLIVDQAGRGLFSFGPERFSVGAIPLARDARAWHYVPASGRLYRVLVEPIRLGASGGWMLAYHAIDSELLGQLAMADVSLFAFYRGKLAAASQVHAETDASQLWLDWGGDVRLRADVRYRPLFSVAELSFGVAIVPLLDALILWLALGFWLLRQTRRVRALGRAAGNSWDGVITPEVAEQLKIAKGSVRDEIDAVATALEDLMAQQHHHEIQLQRALDMFRAVVEGTQVAMLMADRSGRIVMANVAALRLFGREENGLVGESVDNLLPAALREAHGRERGMFFGSAAARPMGLGREVRALMADGSERAVEVGLTPIQSPDGPLALASIVDVSGYKNTQALIGAALREKTTLLNEIHHRVKNNLQIVASLLNLQAGQVSDAGYERLLMESVQRVQAMALVHQLLYESQDFSRVHLGEYLQRLVGLLAGLNAAGARGISVRVDVTELNLELSRAIPCGLIVNEILSNSFKHAFTATGGEIRLSLAREPEGQALLCVSDNGRGLPADFDPAGSRTLGVQLIHTLADQMAAQLVISNGAGARYELRFTPAA